MRFLENATRNLFFTGKGGVGKTSLACAAAVRLADAGKRVLLVSTDPASNLDEVLGVELGSRPTAVPRVAGLQAMNLDPAAAAAAYREKMVGPYRGLLPAAAIASMEEQFSGACTLEIAAFDEFSRLLGDPAATAEFDHVVFDTAPTGHTLRLLTLPSAWSEFMDANTSGASCLGPLAGLRDQRNLYEDVVRALGDPAATTLVLVARCDAAAFREAARTSVELAALEVRNQHLVVNGVFRAADPSDAVAAAMQKRGEAALDALPEALRELPRSMVPLTVAGVVGVESLRALGRAPSAADGSVEATSGPSVEPESAAEFAGLEGLGGLIDGLAAPGRGVVLAMGKGGVGKTTLAGAVAAALADRGFRVRLTTTDPAAQVAAALAGSAPANLSVDRIDPAAETARYAATVLRDAGAGLDAAGRALLEEDLRSPCTEEIAVFRAFAEAVAEGTEHFVVLDTAPTGHTILLLDAALAYHREVLRQAGGAPEAVEKLLPRLRDPGFARVLIATLPEATPVHEAAQLQKDLRRAGIEPYAWVVNQSLAPLVVTDPVLQGRRMREAPFLREITNGLSSRTAVVPWQAVPPVGFDALRALAADDASATVAPAR